MLRHPIYLLLCLFAVLYLALAGARGWSAWHSVTRGFVSSTPGRAGGAFHHK